MTFDLDVYYGWLLCGGVFLITLLRLIVCFKLVLHVIVVMYWILLYFVVCYSLLLLVYCLFIV